jgi:hypothetical protein
MPGHTLAEYALAAYSCAMVFVEMTPFADFRREHWTDEDLRAFQSFLLVSPEAGDLTPRQVKVLADLTRDLKNG